MSGAPLAHVILPPSFQGLGLSGLTPMGSIEKPLRRWPLRTTDGAALPLPNPGRLAGRRPAPLQEVARG